MGTNMSPQPADPGPEVTTAPAAPATPPVDAQPPAAAQPTTQEAPQAPAAPPVAQPPAAGQEAQVPGAAQPPVAQPPAGQQPGADQILTDEAARRFAEPFANLSTRDDAFVQLGRQWGVFPEGMSLEDIRAGLQAYAEFINDGQGGQPLPGVDDQAGYLGDQGQMPAQALDPDTIARMVDERVQAVVQAQREQEQMQRNIEILNGAAMEVAGARGLSEAQRNVLLQNMAVRIDAAQQAGAQVDFSPQAMKGFAEALLNEMAGFAQVEQIAQNQQMVANHMRVAPQTTTPQGPGMAGQPGQKRGLAGAKERALGMIAAQNQAG